MPEGISDSLKLSKIVSIRHCQSKANVVSELIPAKEQNLLRSLIDTELSDFGIDQCESKQPEVNEIDFEIVLVSPMRRTL